MKDAFHALEISSASKKEKTATEASTVTPIDYIYNTESGLSLITTTLFSVSSAYIFLVLASTQFFYSLHPTRLSLTVNCVFDFVYASVYAFFVFVYRCVCARSEVTS